MCGGLAGIGGGIFVGRLSSTTRLGKFSSLLLGEPMSSGKKSNADKAS